MIWLLSWQTTSVQLVLKKVFYGSCLDTANLINYFWDLLYQFFIPSIKQFGTGKRDAASSFANASFHGEIHVLYYNFTTNKNSPKREASVRSKTVFYLGLVEFIIFLNSVSKWKLCRYGFCSSIRKNSTRKRERVLSWYIGRPLYSLGNLFQGAIRIWKL